MTEPVDFWSIYDQVYDDMYCCDACGEHGSKSDDSPFDGQLNLCQKCRSTMLTDDELAAIEAREQAATPGPWWVLEEQDSVSVLIGDQDDRVCELHHGECLPFENANFIAHARQDIPRMVAEIRRMREQLQRKETE